MTAPLHILLDARWIFPEISGIGLYTQELITALAKRASPHTFTLLFNNADVMARTSARVGISTNERFRCRLVRSGPFSPGDQVLLPSAISRWGVEVFHAPNYMMPLMLPGGIKRVVTIHDLIPLLFRDYAPRSKKNRLFPVFKFLMHHVASRADRIIAVSDFTRRDIAEHLLRGPSPGKITVVHEAARAVYMPAPRAPREGVEFLFVGRRDPYKNLPLLIRAFAAVKAQDLPARLRIVGADDPRYPEADRLARELGVHDAITWSGYVSDEGLLDAYQQTGVFVLPSNYEGFGLPVLEAMACGTPVICSNRSSLPEVAGDAALMIDPDQPDTLIDAMTRVIKEPSLRDDLSRRGLARAAQFSWEKTARETIAVYEEAARA